MRKIILGLAVSLDNRIEGPNGEYDWCFTDQDYGMTEFFNSIDAVFYGRKSYEMTKNVGRGEMFGGKENYVFTTNPNYKASDAKTVSGDIREHVQKITSGAGKSIWLFGGTELTNTFLKLGLVDELWLSIHPIVLGKGKLLFDNLDNRIKTKLLDTKAYDTGLVSVRYAVMK